MPSARRARLVAVCAVALAIFMGERRAGAERPIIIDNDDEHVIGESVGVLEDRGGHESLADVTSPGGAARFHDSSARHPNFGFTGSAMWFRFTLENVTDRERTMVVEIGREWIDRVELYRLDTGERLVSGATVAITSRPLHSERLALPLTLASHARTTYLLRLESAGSMALDGTIRPLDRFLELDARGRLLFGGFYAVLLAMAAYNLLLYVSLRERSALQLAGMLAALALAEACSHGHVSRVLPWGAGWFEIRGGALAFAATAAGFGSFTRASLETATWIPTLDRALRATAIVATAAFVVVAAIPSLGAVGFGSLAVEIALILVVSARRVRGRDRDRVSLSFLFAVSSLVVPASYTLASLLGIVPLIPALDQWNHFGAVVMTCLFSLGVGERIRRERDARGALQQQTKQLNFELQQRVDELVTKQREIGVLNEELRHQVAARSKELADALTKLAHHPRAELAPEYVVDGRYRVVRKLGAGGMGSVYEVERLSDRERLAIKRLRGHADSSALARFAREAHIAAELRHPNLVPVIDVGIDDGELFLIMPLVEGGSLASARNRFGDIPWVRRVLVEIATGLAALHERGIVHRDLKPGNILMAGGIARISDFGLAYFGDLGEKAVTPAEPAAPGELAKTVTGKLGRAGLTRVNDVFGTPHYMAPELAHGVQAASPATDIFSFGVIAYELATGTRPFRDAAILVALAGGAYSPPDTTAIDATLRTVIAAALAGDPASRPTARTLADTLA